jgi:hypothetical protein
MANKASKLLYEELVSGVIQNDTMKSDQRIQSGYVLGGAHSLNYYKGEVKS